jgi:hypothetical protein
MSTKYVDSQDHGKAIQRGPRFALVDPPRENDGWVDLEALLQEEVREREIEDAVDD